MSHATFTQPTSWNLNGPGGIQVRYTVAGPALHYSGPHGPKDFTGSAIRLMEVPDVGLLVSVTLVLTVDSGSTTLTVLLPRVNLPAPPALPVAVPVTTEAITTSHHFSLVQAFNHGQQDFYTVTKLTGTAV
jgi:hypothetical protein